jgi:predicted lactoylglutathione lyase
MPHVPAFAPVIIGLPIADRQTSYTFYRDALGLDPVGEPADDGVPEPLQFDLNEGARIMLVPTGGFGWVIGDHQVAAAGTSECVLSITTETDAGVDDLIARASEAGATIVTAPGPQPWGYVGTFADPDGHLWMVVSAARQHD